MYNYKNFMSSKGLNIIQRLRTKSFSSEKGYYTPKPLGYHYVENFDNVTEEDCIKFDNQNKEIYKRNMELYDQISKKMETQNALFKIDSPPAPPDVPNNYEKIVKHKLRNVSKNVRFQSYAIQYLLNKGYKLIFTNTDIKLDLEFESFEAIGLVEKLENNSIENILKIAFEPNTITSHIENSSPPCERKLPPYDTHGTTISQHNSYPSLYPIPNANTQYTNTQYTYPQYSQYPNYSTNYSNQYSYPPPNFCLSSSAPQLTVPTVPTQQNEGKKQVISGPPAAHYMK